MFTVIRNTWALFFGFGIISLAHGLQGTLIGVRSVIEGFSFISTGLVVAGYYVGYLTGSVIIPIFLKRVGHIRVFAALASLASIAILLHSVFLDPYSWFLIRIFTGISLSGIFIIMESWLNDKSTNQTRGKLLSIYMIITFVFVGLGQLLLNISDPAKVDLFILVSILLSFALLPILLSSTEQPNTTDTKSLSLSEFYAISPLGFVGALFTGLAHSAVFGFGAVYATSKGLSVLEVSIFMIIITSFGALSQWPIGYLLDKHTPINDPIDNYGDSLTVNYYKFSIKRNFIKTVLSLFKDLNINIENFIPTPLSSALATLNKDDKALGAICIDLGAGTTSICLMENDNLIFADAIPIGSNNITFDLSAGLNTSVESAERLKTLYGSVFTNPSDEYEIIDVPIIGSDKSQFNQVSRSIVNSYIKPRVEETLELIWQKLKEYNLHKKQIKNIVITGGGSLLEGIEEYTKIIFDSNVRVAKPLSLEGLSEIYQKPQFSQTIGSILYDKSDYEIEFLKNKEKKVKNDILSRFFSWLDKYI